MKILCTATVFLLFGWQGLHAQQDLSKLKVDFETGKTTASQAVNKFLSKHIKEYAYSNDDLENYMVQPLKCRNEPVLDCLNKILKDIPVEALIYKNGIIIRAKKNKSNSNLESATVNMAKTDTISSLTESRSIEELTINAGYYKVSDKKRTGSITKVTAKDIENQPVTNVLSSLQGRMSGVNITQNSGTAGSGFDIQIRGQNSLRTNNLTGIDGNVPLYVVDGVPFVEITPESSQIASVTIPGGKINPLNSLNPNDIESIEILKDADATAIYGSRGANGVILITTKKGKSGKLQVSFNTIYGMSEILSKLTLMDRDQYLHMRRQAYVNDGISNYPSTAYDLNGTWGNGETDWVKTLLGKKASFSNSQLSLSGGNDTTSFLVSFGHNDQATVYGQGFKYINNTFNSNLSHRSKDRKFSLNLSNMFTNQKNNVVRTDMTSRAYTLAPSSPTLYNQDGSLNWAGNTFNNPLAAYNAKYFNDTKLFQTNLNTEYKLTPTLSFKLNTGLNYTLVDELSLVPNTIYNPNLASGASSANSQARQKDQDIFSLIIEPQLNWQKEWREHQLDLLVGGSFQRSVRKTDEMTGIGFESNQFITNIAAAKTVRMGDQFDLEYRYAAAFGRINYQYKKRYILNITGRRDGSSRFGTNNRFANFGAIGAAWIFSQENLIKNSNWISFGKLRGSYGSAGSDNIGDFQYLDNYTVSPTLIYNSTTGLQPSRLFNPDYSWEKTRKLEAALELGILKNKLNLTFAWYRNRSSNQLVGYQLPAVTGFTNVMANLDATVQNTGFEFEFNARPLSTKNFSWESGFNITFPKNKLVSFPGLEGSPYANQYAIGYSTQIVKLYQLEGIDPLTKLYKFTDFNGDGKISAPDDRQVIADLQMKFFGGFTNIFKFKNWDLSILMQFVKKKGINYNSVMPFPGSMNNQPVEVLNVWSSENPDGLYMPYRTTNSNGSHTLFQTSTAAISDASFIRLKNLQLGYRIPLKESIFSNVKIYFQGQNLITLTNFFGVDPESLITGYLPPLRSYSFGIQCNF